MKPPDNVQIFEGELATFWFDENGILCAIGKNIPRSLENQRKNYEFIKQISGNKKVCILSDATSSNPQDIETRNYSAQEMPNVFKAMAVLSDSVLGEFISKTFITVKQQPVPIQFFGNEQEAKEWLKQYL